MLWGRDVDTRIDLHWQRMRVLQSTLQRREAELLAKDKQLRDIFQDDGDTLEEGPSPATLEEELAMETNEIDEEGLEEHHDTLGPEPGDHKEWQKRAEVRNKNDNTGVAQTISRVCTNNEINH